MNSLFTTKIIINYVFERKKTEEEIDNFLNERFPCEIHHISNYVYLDSKTGNNILLTCVILNLNEKD